MPVIRPDTACKETPEHHMGEWLNYLILYNSVWFLLIC